MLAPGFVNAAASYRTAAGSDGLFSIPTPDNWQTATAHYAPVIGDGPSKSGTLSP